LLSGRLADASDLAERALQLSRTHKERGHEAWALKLLGDISQHYTAAKTEEAEDYYRRAYMRSRELGMRPLQAHCQVGLSHIYVANGKLDEARSELAAAIDLYRSLDMTFWLLAAQAAFARLSTN
jgi:tetratricopeptide (TPR) repeat protein